MLSLVVRETLLLLAVLNPVGSIPFFASLTEKLDADRRAYVLNMSVATAFGMVLIFALVGDLCLRHLFGVTLAEFKVAGGILLFIVATRGVLSPTGEIIAGQHDERFLPFFPLAFPLLVGPGTLAMTIILAQRDGQIMMMVTTSVTFIFVFAIIRGAPVLARILGPYAALIIARLLFIFLAAKAVSLTLTGLSEAWKQ